MQDALWDALWELGRPFIPSPDKPTELWINEVGVAPTHQRRGIGRSLVQALLEKGRVLGCVEAWVLTDEENTPARQLYGSAGGEELAVPCT